MRHVVYIYILVNMLVCVLLSERILGIFPVPSYSHQIVYRQVCRELSLRGHKVTMMTPNPLNDPTLSNLTEIDWSFSYGILREHHILTSIDDKISLMELHATMAKLSMKLIEEQFKHPEVQALIANKDVNFDLLILERALPGWLALGEKYNCPTVVITSQYATDLGLRNIGNPTHPVIYPNMNLGFGIKLSYYQRIISTLYSYFLWYELHYKIYPHHLQVARKYLGQNVSDLHKLDRNISLLIANVLPGFGVRATVPAVVECSGMHIQTPQLLPKELQEFLDGADNGVIYISFGSNIKGSLLSLEKRRIIVHVISKFPCKVLWKYESHDIQEKPVNLKIHKWLPQQDVLRHPNVKVFVTQGGLQSIMEAVHFGVPILGIPIVGDQFSNVKQIASLGIGVELDFRSFTAKSFEAALFELLNNSKYTSNAKKLEQLAKDVPQSCLDKAIWWIEYVIRHKGAYHMRSPLLDIPFYQYYIIDVIGFILALTILCIYCIHQAIQLMKFINRSLSLFLKKKTK